MDMMSSYNNFEHNRRKSHLSPRSLKDRFYQSRSQDHEMENNGAAYQNHHIENFVKHEVTSNYGDEDDEKMDDEVEDLSKN
jgi:hypothetical protein